MRNKKNVNNESIRAMDKMNEEELKAYILQLGYEVEDARDESIIVKKDTIPTVDQIFK